MQSQIHNNKKNELTLYLCRIYLGRLISMKYVVFRNLLICCIEDTVRKGKD